MGRMNRPSVLAMVALALLLGACTSSAPRAATSDAAAPARSPTKTLVMIARGEPTNLGAIRMVSAGPAGREIARLFFATLDFADPKGLATPYLEEAVPQVNTESWRVFPDGRMETTYHLRP